jgi:hypothetical protein
MGKTENLKKLTVLLVMVILAIYVTAGALVWAQSGQNSSATPAQSVYGQVVSKAADKASLIVQTATQNEVTISVDQTTAYKIINANPFNLSAMIDILDDLVGQVAYPDTQSMSGMASMPTMSPAAGLTNALSSFIFNATFDNINAGDMALVTGLTNNLAQQIDILKFPANIEFTHGVLSGLGNNGVVITPPSPALGQAVSLGWDDNSRFILKGLSSLQIGQNATVIYDSSSNMVEIAIISPAAPESLSTPSPSLPASPSPSSSPSPGSSPAPGTFSLDLTIQNSQFDKTFLQVPLATQISLNFTNQDSEVQHNFSLYNNKVSTTPIFKGAPITGPASTVYQFMSGDINATYYFRCDFHPNENGQLMEGTSGE